MDFGMPFLLETNSIEECVKLCHTLRLEFVELNMNFPQCQLEAISTARLKKYQEELGIYYTLHVDENLNVCDFNKEVRKAYKTTMCGAIQLAKELGIPIINMHLAKGIYITLPDRKEFLFQQYESEYRQNMIEFREMCEKQISSSNIKIAIENTDGFMDHEKAVIELLLESDCFGLTLDIGHSHAVEDMDMSFYMKHIDRLIHMHAHDAKGKNNHLAFGNGEIDLESRLQLANDANVRVVLETKTIDALMTTVGLIPKYNPV